MPKVSSPDGLTVKQRRFIEAYNGNTTEAAIAAGYSKKSASEVGCRLMKRSNISQAIHAREADRLQRLGATLEERRQIWIKIMNDPNAKDSDKLKATELYGKTCADFVDRVETKGRVEIQVVQRFLEPGTQAKQVADAEVLSIE